MDVDNVFNILRHKACPVGVSYRCGDQQLAGLWLLRLVAAELGNHSTITHVESSTKRKKTKQQRLSFLYVGLMLNANSKLTVYQDK